LGISKSSDSDKDIISSNWKRPFDENNITSLVGKIKKQSGFLIIRERIFKSSQFILPELLKKDFIINKAKYFDCKPDFWIYHFRPEKD